MTVAQRYGPWAIIAGATEGTGSAFARRLAGEGINCVLIARRQALLDSLAAELRASHKIECMTASIDLAAPDGAARIAAIAGNRRVGLVIMNAGSDTNGAEFLDGEASAWVELVNRNVVTTMLVCHHFGRTMRESGRGGIILVGSGACYLGGAMRAAYSATKAFVLSFGEGLWAELQPHGVDVLNLVLGRTDTPALRELLATKGLPIPDGLANPDDIARVGLERLPHGPNHNWGHSDDEPGFGPNSPAARRAAILAMGEASRSIFGHK